MIDKKYIITEMRGPVIFDSLIYHFELGLRAISAGFVRTWKDPDTNRWHVSCYGGSHLMGLEANPSEDEKILEDFLNLR